MFHHLFIFYNFFFIYFKQSGKKNKCNLFFFEQDDVMTYTKADAIFNLTNLSQTTTNLLYYIICRLNKC